jgi:hypothetical protein
LGDQKVINENAQKKSRSIAAGRTVLAGEPEAVNILGRRIPRELDAAL